MNYIPCWWEFASLLHNFTGSASRGRWSELGFGNLIFNIKRYNIMIKAEEYFDKNYGKDHLKRCIELNDIQSIYHLMEEFADYSVKNLNGETVKRQELIRFHDFCVTTVDLSNHKETTEQRVDRYLKSINE